MTEATTNMCAEALLSSWINHFRAPDHITMDCRAIFMSDLWAALVLLMGTSHHRTTTYNPTASLMARCSGDNWEMQLPWVLLSLRTAPRANDKPSPAEKVYGETLVVPGHFQPKDLATSKNIFVCATTHTNRPHAIVLSTSFTTQKRPTSFDRLKPAFLTEEDTDEDEPGSCPRVPLQTCFPPSPQTIPMAPRPSGGH
ncbi:uncharacterized protein LOC135226760 [Macrobrachium nipponense]|uniref:uncharacterized protein LOC135226760 n=1 Tax=Macrobrachium nipponense TaxID=159736 RepID=UPI0030C826AA